MFRTISIACLAALLTGGALAGPVLSSKSGVRTPPPPSYQGRWFTTPDNCTYSRTQAPGYPVQWILVLNPHHVGKPTAHRGCPGLLRG